MCQNLSKLTPLPEINICGVEELSSDLKRALIITFNLLILCVVNTDYYQYHIIVCEYSICLLAVPK